MQTEINIYELILSNVCNLYLDADLFYNMCICEITCKHIQSHVNKNNYM